MTAFDPETHERGPCIRVTGATPAAPGRGNNRRQHSESQWQRCQCFKATPAAPRTGKTRWQRWQWQQNGPNPACRLMGQRQDDSASLASGAACQADSICGLSTRYHRR